MYTTIQHALPTHNDWCRKSSTRNSKKPNPRSTSHRNRSSSSTCLPRHQLRSNSLRSSSSRRQAQILTHQAHAILPPPVSLLTTMLFCDNSDMCLTVWVATDLLFRLENPRRQLQLPTRLPVREVALRPFHPSPLVKPEQWDLQQQSMV